MSAIDAKSFSNAVFPHLQRAVEQNEAAMQRLSDRLTADVSAGKSLFAFGSGHSSIFPMEIYHRAGGPAFVIPIVADFLLPLAGPPVVKVLERTPGLATAILRRAQPRAGEMLWLASNSGINAAVVDLALEAKKMGMHTVAFTSLPHSKAVDSRHASGKRLFEVCDDFIDIGGVRGDSLITLSGGAAAGPFSSLSTILLAHSILVSAMAALEAKGIRCVYTSVNTPEGEARNKAIEEKAAERDPLLR